MTANKLRYDYYFCPFLKGECEAQDCSFAFWGHDEAKGFCLLGAVAREYLKLPHPASDPYYQIYPEKKAK